MPLSSTADVISLLFLLALQERRSQATTQPVRRPATASTAVSHTGTVSVQAAGRGCLVLCVAETVELSEGAVLTVPGAAVVDGGKLLTLVKM